MTTAHIRTASGPLLGSVVVPPDKSISHRAVLFAALAEGTSMLTNLLDSAGVRSTIGAVRALGAVVEVLREGGGSLDCTVHGWGALGPSAPAAPIDCGNSGTTVRLLAGVLAGWPVVVTLTGDESLSARPMGRIMRPLSEMGARFIASEDAFLPLEVGGGALRPIDYASPIASAQVKSAVLLAGLRARGTTRVTEPAPSRDHTERLLPAFGVPVETGPLQAGVTGPLVPTACDVSVPADPSSAAFLIAAALLVAGSEITLPHVCLNPTRTGFLRVLIRMGADVRVSGLSEVGAETTGTITVRYTPGLLATDITADEVPSLIDELPVLALVASCARGVSRFEGAGELRVKEADRLAATVDGIVAFGGRARAGEDWLEVSGPSALKAARVDSLADHRLAMTWAVAGLAATGETLIDRFDAVEVSYPGFLTDITAAQAGAEGR